MKWDSARRRIQIILVKDKKQYLITNTIRTFIILFLPTSLYLHITTEVILYY